MPSCGDMVSSLQNIITCQAHSRVPKCDSGLLVQVNSDLINRMITTPSGVPGDLSKVVHSSYRPICHSSEPQHSTVHISSSRPTSMENRWCEHKLVGSHSIRLPSNSTSLRPSEGDLKNLSVQLAHHPDSPRLAKDALVLGPSAALNGNPTTITGVGSLTTKCFTIIHNISTFMPGF